MAITVDGVTYRLPEQVNDIAKLAPGVYQLAIRVLRNTPGDRNFVGLIERQRKMLAPAGGIGVAAPNQRNGAWDAIKDVKIPFGDAHGGSNKQSFGFWFNYFWSEAREAYDLNAAGQTALCDAFHAVLEADGNGGYRPSAALGTMDYTQMQNTLLKVMRVGFKRVDLNAGSPMKVPKAVDARTLFAVVVSLKGQPEQTLPLGFRGDNRDFAALRGTGFVSRARARQAAVHVEFGMNLPWHPFNQAIYSESLFLRKGHSKDNCLHTVVSVASDLSAMLPYPLLSDGSLFKLAFKDPDTWTADDVNYVQTHWMGLEIVRKGGASGPIDRVTSNKNVYVLDMSRGKGFSTENWQSTLGVGNPFPERAIDGVLPEQIIGLLKAKKHYFYRKSKGSGPGVMTLFQVELLSFEFLLDEAIIQARFGATAPGLIRGFVERGLKTANAAMAGDKLAYEQAQVAATQSAQPTEHRCSCGQVFKNAAQLKFHKGSSGHD